VLIPAQYHTVSRNHAIITRTIDGFVLEDKSKNGTYVNNRRLAEGDKYLLQEGAVILLGGLKEDKEVCCLRYSRTPPKPLSTTYDGLAALDH
jgi:pSer/pThr/pTyr-binding forkhead associated (FHA) protein